MSSTNRMPRIPIALAALLAGVFWWTSLGATTALKFDLESLVANSSRIVVADVQQMRSLKVDGRIYTDTTLEIRETWKGDETETVTVRHPGGRIGDTVTRVHGLPGFQAGERVLVFLKQRLEDDRSEQFTVTGLRQGKFHVALGPDSSTEFVVPRLENLRLLTPKDQTVDPEDVPSPSSETRDAQNLEAADPALIHQKVLSLDDFRQRVREKLTAESDESSTGGRR